VVYSLLNHDCTTFTSRENVLNENTDRTEGIQITIYVIYSKQKQIKYECKSILKCE